MQFIDFFASPDGAIDDIIERHENNIRASVKIQFPKIKGYFESFQEDIAKGNWCIDGRSRNGRLGFNFTQVEEPYVSDTDQTISLTVDIAPFMRDYLLEEWQDWLFLEGDHILKIRRALDQIVGFEELEEKRETGKIRLPRGSYFSGADEVKLAIHEIIPPPHLGSVTHEYLRRVVSGDIGREEMNQFQMPVEGSLNVPAHGGALAHTRLRSGDYSLLIERDQLHGIKHSTSILVECNSPESLYLEFEGNKSDDVTLNFVDAKFLRTDIREVRPAFDVCSYRSQDVTSRAKPVYISNGGNIEELFKIDYKNREDVKKLSEHVRSLTKQHTIYFDEFPTEEILSIIDNASLEDKINCLVFKKLPNSEMGFKDSEVSRIRHLSNSGVQVVWDIEEWEEKRVFYKEGFMTPEIVPHFDKALRSNSIGVIFGSASAYREDVDYERLLRVMNDFKNFVGGEGFIFNGGGPAIMRASSEIAHKLDLYVGNITLMVPGQIGGFDDLYKADVLLPYHPSQISPRQNGLFQVSAAYIFYDPGGVGTAFEFFEAETREKLYRQRKPIFVIGEEGSFPVVIAEDLKIGQMQGTIPHYLTEPHNTHIITDDSGIYERLLDHYNFEYAEKNFPLDNN